MILDYHFFYSYKIKEVSDVGAKSSRRAEHHLAGKGE